MSGIGLEASYVPVTSTLTLSGVGTVEEYEQVLRTVTYSNTAEVPNLQDRTIEFVVNDGHAHSNTSVLAFTTVKSVNIINGTVENDTLTEILLDDQISGFAEDDIITGQGGFDSLFGNAGREMLRGESGEDALYSGIGNDVLIGREGNDLLDGGAGSDFLIGSAGADRFVLPALEETDVITDFIDGQDSFLLRDGLTFDDLVISQIGNRTTIQLSSTSEFLVVLLNVQATTLGAEDFATLV